MSDKTLTPELLLAAYATGIFPMAEHRDDSEVYWVDPRRRGVLPLDGLHVSRSLARRMRRGGHHATLDVAFDDILDACADREDTWINGLIREMTIELHRRGHAHAFGVWHGERLVGGLYGLRLGAAFFGESMFSAETDGSKMAMVFTVDHLRRCGFTLFDTQFLTPHLERMGAREIPRHEYRDRLAAAISLRTRFEDLAFDGDAQAVVQRMTQTS